MLRAILWAWHGNICRATCTASRLGGGFSLLLILVGVLNTLRGNIIGGMWMFLIGMFLGNAAAMSYQQLAA